MVLLIFNFFILISAVILGFFIKKTLGIEGQWSFLIDCSLAGVGIAHLSFFSERYRIALDRFSQSDSLVKKLKTWRNKS